MDASVAWIVVLASAAAAIICLRHFFRGELVGTVKGLLQGEASVPGSTPTIFVRRFVEAGGASARAELQVGLVDSRRCLEIDTGSAEGLAQALREADAWARGDS